MHRTFAASLLVLASAIPASSGSIEEKAQLCASCHGEKGIPQDNATPIIWGQNEGYLYLQLRDYRKGARKHELMSAVAADIERDEALALAEYFSKLDWPDLQQPAAPADVARLAVRVNASIGCTGCHLDRFQGDGSTARLAGQQHDYLARTALAFRDRSRGNNPGMSDLMNAASEDELEAMAAYLAGL